MRSGLRGNIGWIEEDQAEPIWRKIALAENAKRDDDF